MARDGSGNYNLPSGINPVVAGTTIEAADFNTTMTDVASALTGSLPRDGQAGMTGPFRLADGSVSVPAFGFNSEASTGLYRPGTATLAFTVGAAETARFMNGNLLVGTTSDGGQKFQVSGSASVSGNLVLGTASRIQGDFGSGTLANRPSFQSNVTNGGTVVQMLPNGTSTVAGITSFDTSDTLNAGLFQTLMDGSNARINSSKNGTGTTKPISLQIDGTAALTIGTGRNVTIAAPASGDALTVAGTTILDGGSLGLRTTNTEGVSRGMVGVTPDGLGRAAMLFVNTNSGSGSDSRIDFYTNKFGVNRDIRMTIAPEGNVVVNPPASGNPLSARWAGNDGATVSGTSTNVRSDLHLGSSGESGVALWFERATGAGGLAQQVTAGGAKSDVISWSSSRNVTINAPSSGNTALTVNLLSQNATSDVIISQPNSGGGAWNFLKLANDVSNDAGVLSASSTNTGVSGAGSSIGLYNNRSGGSTFLASGGQARLVINSAGSSTFRSVSSGTEASLVVENAGNYNFGTVARFRTTGVGTDPARIGFESTYAGPTTKHWAAGGEFGNPSAFAIVEDATTGATGTTRFRVSAGGAVAVTGSTLTVNGSNVWTAATLTNLNQLTNGPGYITGITSGNVTTALGYTPYNSSNPSGYFNSSSTIVGAGSWYTTGPQIQVGTGQNEEKRLRMTNANRDVYFYLNGTQAGLYDVNGGISRWQTDTSGNFTANGTITANGLLYGRGGGAGLGQITVSTGTPSGGANGDLWLRY
jgi:hypothetical protein